MRSEWGESLNEGMKRAGISEETLGVYRHLMYRGAPLRIPAPYDFPYMGYLKNPEIAPAADALLAAGPSAFDTEIRAAVAQLSGWLDRALVLNSDLVFFTH